MADYPSDVPVVAFRDVGGEGYVCGRDFHMVLSKLIERDKRIAALDSGLEAVEKFLGAFLKGMAAAGRDDLVEFEALLLKVKKARGDGKEVDHG